MPPRLSTALSVWVSLSSASQSSTLQKGNGRKRETQSITRGSELPPETASSQVAAGRHEGEPCREHDPGGKMIFRKNILKTHKFDFLRKFTILKYNLHVAGGGNHIIY